MKLRLLVDFHIHSKSKNRWKTRECDKLLEENGFSSYSEVYEYGSDTFYKLLDLIGDKYPFCFKPLPELTKKEMDKQKAFIFDSFSFVPAKNTPFYSVCDEVPYKKVYFNKGMPFAIEVFVEIQVKGTIKWKPNYFKSEDGSNHIYVPQEIKEIIEKNNLSGCNFGNIEHKTKKTLEKAYVLYADSLMENDFILDKLTLPKEHKDEDTNQINKYIEQSGTFIFPKNSLDNIKDFSYINKPTHILCGELLVSQKFRQLYLKNKLKGGNFENIFEVGTESFEWYNETITNLAKDLQSYNKEHAIGLHGNINPKELLNGVLP